MDFLGHLYASTRADEMLHSGWDAAAIATFLEHQFDTQHRYYQTHFPDAEFLLIERGGQAVGRLYLLWEASNLKIIDIALLPSLRGQGMGSALLHDLIVRADMVGLSIGLHVESYNPAQHLYQRLGFEIMDENGVYLRMQRPPHPTATPLSNQASAQTAVQ
ncbi:GNAT family N-acetyltransferase [Ectopseudomonas mendocina]|nr:GNAT family N-acetyltransferase [Pseudomonas mendocina]